MEWTPTLWRTCRVLAGPTRLELLRRILETPDPCVTELAEALDISETRASQELRRLQARGLVQAARVGRHMRYRPVPDPNVASAKPLLAAMKTALAPCSPELDEQTFGVARAFSHERRLSIARALLNGPRLAVELHDGLGIPSMALHRHLRTLRAGGVVRRSKGRWELAPNPHPLAKTMKSLLAG